MDLKSYNKYCSTLRGVGDFPTGLVNLTQNLKQDIDMVVFRPGLGPVLSAKQAIIREGNEAVI